MDKNLVIRDDFLTGLLDLIEDYNNRTESDAEKELMYKLLVELNNSIDFTNED